MAEHTDRLVERLRAEGLVPGGAAWTPFPNGWPDEISTALIDAVFSARARYKTASGAGIHRLVSRWREEDAAPRDSLPGLAEEIRAGGPRVWADAFGNLQHSPRRVQRRPNAPWKSAAVLEAADALIDIGVITAGDVTDDSIGDVSRALRSVPGIGQVTADYFLMLLGRPGVKADTMVLRYLNDALGRERTTTASAVAEVRAAADELGGDVVDLEHSIWALESARARSR